MILRRLPIAKPGMALPEEGPHLPPWWLVKRAVPEANLARRFPDEIYEAISIPWHLLEHWSKYTGEKGPGGNGYIKAINELIEKAGYHGRIRENAVRVENALVRACERSAAKAGELQEPSAGFRRRAQPETSSPANQTMRQH